MPSTVYESTKAGNIILSSNFIHIEKCLMEEVKAVGLQTNESQPYEKQNPYEIFCKNSANQVSNENNKAQYFIFED